ncbi:MAG: hypothetical protein AB1813_03730 [Verrucomicrobiota bacterium]
MTRLLTVCLWLGLTANASAVNEAKPEHGSNVRYVVGLSPFLDKSVKDEVYRRLVVFLLEQMPVESSLWIYDAYHQRTITQIDIPNVRAFQSGKTRANQFKDPIRKLKEFLAANPERPSAQLNLESAIRLPHFMDFVGETVHTPGGKVVAIILGSPLYVDHKEPGFSMLGGYFPSDGHLTASRDQSVFGLKERAGLLQGMTVHFGYFGDPWVSEIHREKITRFWTLYLRGQGARLQTFCGDLATIFQSVRTPAETAESAEDRYALDAKQTKLEMLRITRDVGVADWITREELPHAQLQPPSRTVGPMKIGIRWQGRIDLDLYASPRRAGETLYFEHTRTADGYYFKDHRSSPDREYEFIEFETPVDVWEVQARVNFFEGRAPGGTGGEVRIEFDGKIYSSRFSIAASHGNEGREGPAHREYWTVIDVPGVLKLRGARTGTAPEPARAAADRPTPQ